MNKQHQLHRTIVNSINKEIIRVANSTVKDNKILLMKKVNTQTETWILINNLTITKMIYQIYHLRKVWLQILGLQVINLVG